MKNTFEDKVRDAFDHHEDDINPALIWEGISSREDIGQKKKRRFFIWWFAGIGFSIVFFSALIYVLNTETIENKDGFASSNIKQSNSEKADSRAIATIVTNHNDEDNTIMTNTDESNTRHSSEVQSKKSNHSLSNSESESKLAEHNRNASFTKKYETKNRNSTDDKSSIDISIDEIQRHTESKNNEPHTVNKDKTIVSIFETDNKHNSTIALKRDHLNIDLINGLLITKISSLLENQYQELQIDPQNNSDATSTAVSYLSTIEMYGGISTGAKTSYSSNQEYATTRNTTEELLEQLNIGTRIQLIDFHNFEFWTGVRYYRITDLWKMDLEYSEDAPYTYIDYTVEFPDGSIEDHFKTVTAPYTIKRFVEQYNTEQILSFPLEVRYAIESNNWSYALGLGLEFNYLLGAEHTVLGTDHLPTSDNKQGLWMDPSISLGFHTSYRLNPNWDIKAGLNYRSLSINNSSLINDLRSEYTLFGLELGVARKFGR